jgi:hypothetical protein
MKTPMTTEQSCHLAKVCAQLNITVEAAIARHDSLEYGPLMARLIEQRKAASFEAKKGDIISDNQRISLEAHKALATSRGDTALVAQLTALLTNFSATYALAHQAMNICISTQGKPASQFFPKRENSSSGQVAPAASIDISSVVMPEEAV